MQMVLGLGSINSLLMLPPMQMVLGLGSINSLLLSHPSLPTNLSVNLLLGRSSLLEFLLLGRSSLIEFLLLGRSLILRSSLLEFLLLGRSLILLSKEDHHSVMRRILQGNGKGSSLLYLKWHLCLIICTIAQYNSS
jgi:hypothetical protein